MGWTRETKWVQGALLTGKSLQALCRNATSDSVAVAISHSCDIANDNLNLEPVVEFVLARPIETRDGNLSGAKNPRRLHLRTSPRGESQYLELEAGNKFTISKTELVSHEPDTDYKLETGEFEVLQAWLAARYRRQALPDALVERLKPVFKKMETQGGKHPQAILGYWLNYEPREELPEAEPYEVWISVVYSTEQPEFESTAIAIAETLNVAKKPAGIEPLYCSAFSEEEFTLKDLRQQVLYRAEHLSYRTDTHGPTVEA